MMERENMIRHVDQFINGEIYNTILFLFFFRFPTCLFNDEFH